MIQDIDIGRDLFMKKKVIAVLCAAAMTLPIVSARAEYTENDLKNAIQEAIDWKNDEDNPYYSIGTESSDMYIMALNRLGWSFDYNSYLVGLDGIAAGYDERHNASDMQRTALATSAAGGDARNVGGRDLIADSTYYRDSVSPMDKEGVDGLSWGLLALDSGDYNIPDWALRDRNEIIAGILSHQNTDGSFDNSIYSTASAICALAPYYETSGAYTVVQNQTGYTIDISPQQAVDSALEYLEDEQEKDGDWGDLRSTAMTVIALNSLGINADGDSRFDERRDTPLDGLMMYQEKDGGFSNDLNDEDGEATSYALCAMVSQLRLMQDKSSFFRFSVNDTVTFATPKPQTNTATTKPTSTKKPTATQKPTSTKKPTTTKKPTATQKATATLAPKKTTTPRGTAEPTTKPTVKPTKRPALVGPIEMPGPMPSFTPSPDANEKGAGNSHSINSSGDIVVMILIPIAVILAAAGVVLIFLIKKYGTVNEFISSINNKKQNTDNEYKAKQHRKTEEHERFKKRGKFREHRKINNRKFK